MSLVFEIGEWIGTAAFAVSGAMVAIDRGADLFGVLLLAVITAVGGGTLRDVLIGCFPPRMFLSSHYVLLSVVCALAVFLLARILKEHYFDRELLIGAINNVFDAIGLGVFAVSGARIGIEAGYGDNLFLVVFLGTTTAIGGGMLRDTLIRQVPFVLRKHVYAVAAIAGAMTYALLARASVHSALAYGAGWAVTVSLRMLATVFRWNLPKAFEPGER